MALWQAGQWEGRVKEVGKRILKNPATSGWHSIGEQRWKGILEVIEVGLLLQSPFQWWILNYEWHLVMSPSCPPVGRRLGKPMQMLLCWINFSGTQPRAYIQSELEKCVMWLSDPPRHKCPIHWILDPTRAGCESVNPWDMNTFSFIFLTTEDRWWDPNMRRVLRPQDDISSSRNAGTENLPIDADNAESKGVPRARMIGLGLGKWVPWIRLLPHK